MDAVDVSNLDGPQRLALAKELATNIRDSLPKELYAGSFTLKSKLPFRATSLREVLIHRLSDLADVALELYDADRLVPAFMVTRGVVETVAMTYWLHQKTTEFLESKDEKAYDEFLMRGTFGSKDSTPPPQPYNVLKAIDHLDKKFSGLRKMYDRLCEFTHPNYSGAMGSYSKLDSEGYILHLGESHGKPPISFGIVPLIASLTVFQDYYNALADKLKEMNDSYEKG